MVGWLDTRDSKVLIKAHANSKDFSCRAALPFVPSHTYQFGLGGLTDHD